MSCIALIASLLTAFQRLGATPLLLLWLVCNISAASEHSIPDRPTDGKFLYDFADVVDDATESQIRALQSNAWARCKTPIVVVTIGRMHDYSDDFSGIEQFARDWFDSWEIGSRDKNDGILVLVSRDDRKARIELGADWGHRFDEACKRVMDYDMSPQFKRGKYGAGLVHAVESLSTMAQAGPRAAPPSPGMADEFIHHPAVAFIREDNPIADHVGHIAITVLIIAGLGCFIAAFFFPEQRKFLVITSICLLGLALLFWVVVIIGALIVLNRTDRNRRYYRNSSWIGDWGSGGSFGGGFSGGGGASGSW